MKFIEFIIIALFVVWAVLSILFQFDNSKILKYNFWGFVPYCRFFAPNPVSRDIRIYYRPLATEDEKDSVWYPFLHSNKRLISFIWSPEMRTEKAVTTLVKQLRHLNKNQPNIQYSFPYLKILNVVETKVRHTCDSNYLQFMITQHKGFEDETRGYIFISNVHRFR